MSQYDDFLEMEQRHKNSLSAADKIIEGYKKENELLMAKFTQLQRVLPTDRKAKEIALDAAIKIHTSPLASAFDNPKDVETTAESIYQWLIADSKQNTL